MFYIHNTILYEYLYTKYCFLFVWMCSIQKAISASQPGQNWAFYDFLVTFYFGIWYIRKKIKNKKEIDIKKKFSKFVSLSCFYMGIFTKTVRKRRKIYCANGQYANKGRNSARLWYFLQNLFFSDPFTLLPTYLYFCSTYFLHPHKVHSFCWK